MYWRMPGNTLLEFHVIVQNDVRHHCLELINGEEASRAGMLAMTEWNELFGSIHALLADCIALRAHLRNLKGSNASALL